MTLETQINNLATAVGTQSKALKTLINGNAADLSALSTTAQGNLVLAINEVLADVNALGVLVNNGAADLSALTTTAQANLVAAINEVKGIADAAAGGGVSINDGATNTTQTWSSQQISDTIDSDVATAVNDLVGGASAAYDTLIELANEIQANDADLVTVLSNQSKRVAVDQVQTFTAPEQLQGRSNIGAQSAADIGDTAADFVAVFNAALV